MVKVKNSSIVKSELANQTSISPIEVKVNLGGELTICSFDLAIGLEIQHKNLLETIRTYKDSVSIFGGVTFETEPFETAGGKQERVFVNLNENQALFIGSLSRNTKRVVEFKVALISEFDRARKLVNAQQAKEEHEKAAKAIAKLEKKVDKLIKEQDDLRAYIVQVNTTPPIVPAHELKNKVLASIKQVSDRPYTSKTFSDVYTNFVKDMRFVYNINLDRIYVKPGEDVIDALIREGYSRQINELATFKYTTQP